MDFLELAAKRQSTRSYNDEPVEREKIERCLQSARIAPSACNCQPWKFVVVDEPELKNFVAKQTFGKLVSINRFAIEAPVLVLIVGERQKPFARFAGIVKKKPFAFFDIGIAAEHFCLQATEEGLGTCMLGWFNEKTIAKRLGIPKNKRVELLITVGYAAKDEIRQKQRKELDEIRSYNSY